MLGVRWILKRRVEITLLCQNQVENYVTVPELAWGGQRRHFCARISHKFDGEVENDMTVPERTFSYLYMWADHFETLLKTKCR